MFDPATISTAHTGLKVAREAFDSFIGKKVDAATTDKMNLAIKQVTEAQDALFSAQGELFRLQNEVQILSKELESQNDWKSKLDKYELIRTTGGALVYFSKSEPAHHACPSCVEDEVIGILQPYGTQNGTFKCPICEGKYPVNPKIAYQHPQIKVSKGRF